MLKTKKFRRLLAGLLAVLMLSICVPAMAFAAGGEEARVLNVTFSYTDEDSNQYYGKTYTFDEAKTSMVVPDAAAIGVTVDGDYYWYTDVYSKEDTLHAGDVKNILDYNDYDGEYITYNLKVVEADKPKVHTFMVSFVDAEQGEVKKVGPIEMGYSGDFTYAGFCEDYAGQGVKLPDGYELAEPNENFKLTADTTEVVILIKPTTQTVGVNYWDVENDKQAAEGEVTVPADATNVNSSALTDIPEGYELVWTGDFQINDGWIWVEVRPVATTQTVGVNYWDVENDKQAAEGEVTVPADATNVNSSALTDIPEGYELVWTGDFQINDGWIYVEVRPAVTMQTVGVNYWDVENDKQAAEGEVTVPADATNVNSSALTDIPEGYELVWTGDFPITDGWIYVEVKPIQAGPQEIGVNYWDVINNKQVYEGTVTVDAGAYNVNSSLLTDIPEGYELVWTGDFQINDGWIWVEVRPVPRTVGVNYWDVEANKQVCEGEVTVDDVDATHVNSSALTDIPEGYELVWTGDFQINDGWVWVEVRPVATTQTVGVNYWDVENDKQAAEGEVTVPADATNVNSSALTDIPEGYELVWTGDFQINDGWIYVEVRPVVTMQTVGVNYWDVENDKQAAEGEVTVPADATNVNSSALTDIPEGYELVWTGDFQIMDGWIYVEVRPVATTQIVGVNYWDIINNKQVTEGEVTVAADAWKVNSSELTDIPENYELVWTGDFQIMDGWIYVEVRPATRTVGLNYWDIVNNEQVAEGSVEVPMSENIVNTSTFTDIPEGYELVWTGDLQIMDGWVWVEVRPIKTLRIYWAIDNGDAADFADGNADSYTQELTWKHIHDDIDMPELTIADGYKLAGWTVGGKNSEYWDADLATTNVGDRFVEDENGGIISITANVVADSTPTTPSTGDNTSTATGDTHPDIAEGIANGTWGAAPAASSDPAAATSTIPQTSDNLPLAALVIVAVVAAGAVCGLVVLRKRSNQ